MYNSPTLPVKSRSAFIYCDYDEFQPETYRSICLNVPEGQGQRRLTFASGDFDRDYAAAMAFANEHSQPGTRINHSSTIDDFQMDRRLSGEDASSVT